MVSSSLRPWLRVCERSHPTTGLVRHVHLHDGNLRRVRLFVYREEEHTLTNS